ncbi:hypothetical protein IEO21_07874 [Rhodonia placenta]|uniref:Uncharacterized protein n=1 Tax=Rhodonia placenta TaxID=104341 RepID=A0A8H7NXR1_9APHY|nr:hypothetical protein IEO21_07874 [Postia placenta]
MYAFCTHALCAVQLLQSCCEQYKCGYLPQRSLSSAAYTRLAEPADTCVLRSTLLKRASDHTADPSQK